MSGTWRIAVRPDEPGSEAIDEVVAHGVGSFHAEMMSDRELWMACRFPDTDEELVMRVTVRRGRLEFRCFEQPAESDAFTYEGDE